jgi:hypothetical protein
MSKNMNKRAWSFIQWVQSEVCSFLRVMVILMQNEVYHGKNKFNEMMNNVPFVLDQHAELNLYSASSLKLSVGRL